jgi:glutamate racemase
MIGIFDSGLGGLTVLKEIKKFLPEYDYLYLGDTAHVPYGNRSGELIYDLTRRACDFLFDEGATLIILACNTATAYALRRLQQEYLPARRKQCGQPVNILGVVRPVAEYFATRGGARIGVIGTRATVNSRVYETEIHAFNKKQKIYTASASLLVPLIEENLAGSPELRSILKRYLLPLKAKKIDSLILGCTHYPLIQKEVAKIMGVSCFVPNPGAIVARSLRAYLSRHPEIDKLLGRGGQRQYYVTDLTQNFELLAKKFLHEKVTIKNTNYNLL